MSKGITRTDVARHANVSRATVSYVLNDQAKSHSISDATIQRVVEAIHELGYAPRHLAQAMQHQRSRCIAVIGCSSHVPPLRAEHWQHRCAIAAQECGWYATCLDGTDDLEEQLGNGRFQAVIQFGDGLEAPPVLQLPEDMPLVRIGHHDSGRRVNWSAEQDLEQAFAHLRLCGCRHVRVLHDPQDMFATSMLAHLPRYTTDWNLHIDSFAGQSLASIDDCADLLIGDRVLIESWRALGPQLPALPCVAAAIDTARPLLRACSGVAIPWSAICLAAVDLIVDDLDEDQETSIAGTFLPADSTLAWDPARS